MENHVFFKKIIFYYNKYLWYIRQIFFLSGFVFFLATGIYILLYAYRSDDPFLFVMLFFVSNFLILISLVLIAAFVYRIKKAWQSVNNKPDDKKRKN
jgi:energy-coupling factor transporter transmembrane protein EcfT